MSTKSKLSVGLLSLFVITLGIWKIGAKEMDSLRYLASFKTENSYCFAYINGLAAANNLKASSGTISAGLNATPYLENGTNDIAIKMASITAPKDLALLPDSRCELLISANTPEQRFNIASVIADADENNEPTGANTPQYNGSDKLGPVSEGKQAKSVLYVVERTFEVKGLPNWAWTTASPLSDTSENRQKIKDRYMDLWLFLKRKEIDALEAQASIAMSEMAPTESMSPHDYWLTIGINEALDDGKTAMPIEWEQYEIKFYKGGRLIRLEDSSGRTPLKLEDTDTVFSYNPYLSLVNGKLVITR